MAHRRHAGQPVDHLAAGEVIADEAHAAFGMEALAVERDDAGGFLAAMLQGVEAERRDGGGVGVSKNAEDAAFFPQAVALTVDVEDPGVDWGLGQAVHRVVHFCPSAG